MVKVKEKDAATELGKRLLKIIKATDWNQSDLARAAGTNRQTVSSWINGPNETMADATHAMNLQAASGFNALWIMTGKGPERVVKISLVEQRVLDKIRESPEILAAIETILGTRP